jgi:hypothetical protein
LQSHTRSRNDSESAWWQSLASVINRNPYIDLLESKIVIIDIGLTEQIEIELAPIDLNTIMGFEPDGYFVAFSFVGGDAHIDDAINWGASIV